MSSKVAPERRNAQILTNLPATFDAKVPKEPPHEREMRMRREMKISNKVPYINSIPYEYVGNDIRHLYPPHVPEEERLNYPDWHKLTPAYKLSFAGMTTGQHAKSFFTWGNPNSGLNRAKRWASEDKVIIYSDLLDKISSLAGILILVMVFVITIIQIRSDSQIAYHANNPENHEDVKDAELLTKLSNNTYWNITKLFLTGVPTLIAGYNVFKRTTLPHKTVRITSFDEGLVEKGAVATDHNLRRRNRGSESEESVGPMPSLVGPLPQQPQQPMDQRTDDRTATIRSMLPMRMGFRDEVSSKNRSFANNNVETYKYAPTSTVPDDDHQFSKII